MRKPPCGVQGGWWARGGVLAWAGFAAYTVTIAVKVGPVTCFSAADRSADGVPHFGAVSIGTCCWRRCRRGCRGNVTWRGCRRRCGCGCRRRCRGRRRTWRRRIRNDPRQRVRDNTLLNSPVDATRDEPTHGNDCRYSDEKISVFSLAASAAHGGGFAAELSRKGVAGSGINWGNRRENDSSGSDQTEECFTHVVYINIACVYSKTPLSTYPLSGYLRTGNRSQPPARWIPLAWCICSCDGNRPH